MHLLFSFSYIRCEVVQCSVGEADYVIARNMRRPKAYAVISNDSDFCVFKDCHFIPNELFDLENDLQLGTPQLPEKPIRLRCSMISSQKVVSSLGVSCLSQIVEFADNSSINYMYQVAA